ncbi:hypothetical protein EXIGLDRAFT_737177 [Exidia glandulosa HHB12029]|uniref:DRBM domain-containing protein n=1 Tax=Exidia glandulosa HHB12029 TaxID=1314781 RepID=A0A166A5H9_EXIGL|nr:hypothetical protein EXIGLDRAFT_722489 [Exidia glandulosa HHB12029]KZV94283.1 hypothetical protein EXIGLDRAFT_737177 [Exidia glandulosa HHB12029]
MSDRLRGYVMQLNNYYQRHHIPPQSYIRYSESLPVGGRGDQCVATVTLLNYQPPAIYTGYGVGKQSAKEAAACNALRALGQLP